MPKTNPPDRRIEGSVPLSTQVLMLGNDHIVSFAGTSQFTAQGVSACGLAAFNFARVGFRIEQCKKNLPDVLNELGKKEVIEEIVAICAGWSSDLHLEVDDIHKLPIFSRSLKLLSVEFGRPGPKHFRTLLEIMKEIKKSAVMIITRPPEIIACFKFVNANADARPDTLDDPLFVVFDSHPRPSHPHGAGLSFSTSIDSTARTLSDILPTVDESIFDSSDFQWQAQLLSNCSAHVYIARHPRKNYEEAVVQSSLAILALRARISELRHENETLGTENKELQSKVDRLQVSVRLERMDSNQRASSSPTAVASRLLGGSYGLVSHAVAGPSWRGASGSGMQKSSAYNRSSPMPSSVSVQNPRPARPSQTVGSSGAQSIFANNPPPVPSKTPPTYDDLYFEDESGADSDDAWVERIHIARELQDEFDSEDRRLRHEHGAQSIFANNPSPVPSKTPPTYDGLHFEDESGVDSEDAWIESMYIARELQDKFDSEDRRLRQEHAQLAHYVQATFQCSICIDELPEDDVAKVGGCMHTMCRTCLREFVSSKIQEHRYPIFCPVCTITAESRAQPGVISRPLIEQLGVSEEQSQILTEMELAEFTIQIHCRECRRPAFVDREDYSDVINIVCPQRDCQHVWCKKCEQTIVIDGPKHSCDGSNELAHLMKEKGWKHCPNCKTPIQKETGCNHMSCISPGCNTHFCYICGGMIVRSALNHEINQAVSAHFRKCQLFEVPN